MAVARKIKTLLTVNILVFVGIILFSVYCRIQDRSEELIQIGRISDQRLRARSGKVSNLVDRQSILQRLERLEDVVYNQLNGRKQLHSLRSSNFGSIWGHHQDTLFTLCRAAFMPAHDFQPHFCKPHLPREIGLRSAASEALTSE